MGNAGSAVQAAQAKNQVTSQFNKITGGDKDPGPTEEELKAKERMREERDRRDNAKYAEKRAAHAANKKRLSDAWSKHKQANQAK